MLIKQLSVFIQNQPGHLAEITEILAKNNIDIRSINVSEGNDFGILRLIVDDPYKASHILKEEEYLVKMSNVLAIEPLDEPGSLAKIFRNFADHGIGVDYIYSIIQPVHDQKPTVIIKTSDPEQAKVLLDAINVPVVPSDEVYNNSL